MPKAKQSSGGSKKSDGGAITIAGTPIYAFPRMTIEPKLAPSVADLPWTESQVSIYQQQGIIAELNERVSEMSVQISALTNAIHALVRQLQNSSADEDVLKFVSDDVRDVDIETAKAEILRLFESRGGAVYYSDIVSALRLDVVQVVEACRALEREGAIEATQ